jgi:menaquinol-cytochrome c reductase iron-sulfur subunit
MAATRRRFLVWMMAVASSLLGLILGIPFINSLVGRQFNLQKEKWIRVADLQSIPEGEPVRLNFIQDERDAYMQRSALHSIWVVRMSASDITAYSPICPHAGCYYNWSSQFRRFVCPCHESIFELNGNLVSGPSPRPLDSIPAKIENGALFVEWKRFRSGVAEKIEI